MSAQYYLYDPQTLKYSGTNFFDEQPLNSVDYAPHIDTEFAKVDLENNTWVDYRTQEEINAAQFPIYKNRLIDAYCFLIKRAKASAMQKELNPDYQQCLEIAYNLKHEIASGSKTNAYVESLMQSEAENPKVEILTPVTDITSENQRVPKT